MEIDYSTVKEWKLKSKILEMITKCKTIKKIKNKLANTNIILL